MVDVGCRFTYDLKEFSHKTEAISGSFKDRVQINGDLYLHLFIIEILSILQDVNPDLPHLAISKL